MKHTDKPISKASIEHSVERFIRQSLEVYGTFFETVVLPNLTRNDYYRIIHKLMSTYEHDEGMLQELYEIELFLIGHCADTLICRFPNEPDTQSELTAYVRSMVWAS